MKKYLLLSIVIAFHLFILINLQFTAWPEMLSYPYLRNNGYLLYKDMIHPYPPILTMGLSLLFGLFGYKLEVLKAVTWLTIVASDIIIYLIVKQLTKKINIAIASVLAYVSIQPFLEGNMMWFDLAIVPFVLLGILNFLNPVQKKHLIISGFSFATAALIKQTSGLFLLVNGVYLLFQKNIRGLVSLSLGSFVLGLLLLIRLLTEGALEGFLNWTLIYPFKYWTNFPGYVDMRMSNYQVFVLILLFAPVFFGLIFLKGKFLKDKNLKLLFLYLLAALMMVYPRFSFFHFQLALSLLVIMTAYIYSMVKSKKYLYLILVLSVLIVIFIPRPGLARNWNKETRFWGSGDIALSSAINKKVHGSRKVFLLGIHSGHYIYTDTLPSKIWTDNFGWYLELPGVQENILTKWEENLPDYVFWQTPESGNWYDLATYQPKLITDWIRRNYELDGSLGDNITVWKKRN